MNRFFVVVAISLSLFPAIAFLSLPSASQEIIATEREEPFRSSNGGSL